MLTVLISSVIIISSSFQRILTFLSSSSQASKYQSERFLISTLNVHLFVSIEVSFRYNYHKGVSSPGSFSPQNS